MSLTPQEKHRLMGAITNVLVKHLEPLFTPDVQLTIIARKPGNDEADVMVSSEADLGELTKLVARSIERSPIKGTEVPA